MAIRSFSGEYEFLSNFYNVAVNYKGTYGSAEAAYQAQKAASLSDAYEFQKYNPGKAKRMGRKIKMRPDWEEVKVAFMRDVVFAKFVQNPELADKLIATGDNELIEGNSWRDIFWGRDLETDGGENNLGKILMNLREELKNPEIILLNGENVIFTRFTVRENTKCHFTTPNESFIELEFARKYEFKHKNWNKGLSDCKYSFRDRIFNDLSFRNGTVIKTLYDEYGIVQRLMEYADGKKFFYQSNEIPVFDSDDAQWDNINEQVFLRDGKEIILIRSKHGWEIPSIEIYIGLKNLLPTLEEIILKLGDD